LALQSCIDYKNVSGYIDKKNHPTKVDIMFKKKIKMLIDDITNTGNAFLVTQDVEKYVWKDTSTKPTFNSEIESTDNEVENEIMANYEKHSQYIYYTSHKIDWSNTKIIYYTKVWSVGKKCSMHQINIKEKITCMSCGNNFYVVVTNNCKTFSWGIILYEELNTTSSTQTSETIFFTEKPYKVAEFIGKTIVKVACGMNIAKIKKVSDIAVIDYNNFVKSSTNGLVYAWGFIFDIPFKKSAACEYTNAFDISNLMIAHSPMSVACEFINEEFSTSDLTIMVEKQLIYVHKVILKIRSTYFKSMFQTNYIENRQSVIENNYYRYVVYKKFLEYLYTGEINLSFENLLRAEYYICIRLKYLFVADLLQLADLLCEKNLQMDCIRKIKKTINLSNIMNLFKLINDMNEDHHKKVTDKLMKYCFDFYFKNMMTVNWTESFETLDVETKAMLIDKGSTFLLPEISSSKNDLLS
ncbi:RCBT1 protein, partial [Acromyrmex insinuator]